MKKETRIEIFEYIRDKSISYPEMFTDARLHKYFTEDLVSIEEVDTQVNILLGFIQDIQLKQIALSNWKEFKARW